MTNPDERVAAVARAIEAKIGAAFRGETGRKVAEELAQAAIAANDKWLKDNGLVVVPVEPTEAMIRAGTFAPRVSESPAVCCYKAMIEAARP